MYSYVTGGKIYRSNLFALSCMSVASGVGYAILATTTKNYLYAVENLFDATRELSFSVYEPIDLTYSNIQHQARHAHSTSYMFDFYYRIGDETARKRGNFTS